MAALGEGPDEVGSASEWVEVPDLRKGRLTLSSLFLARARGEAAAAGDAGLTRDPGEASRRRFPAGSELDVVLFAYNARADAAGAIDLAVRYRLCAEGRVLHEFASRPLPSGDGGPSAPVPGGARLSLAGLPPGEYVLQAVVEDRRAGTTAERGVGFTVE